MAIIAVRPWSMGGRQRPTSPASSAPILAPPRPRPARRSNRRFRQQVAAFRHLQRLGHKLGDLKEAEATASRKPPPLPRWPRSALRAPCRRAAWPGGPDQGPGSAARRAARSSAAQSPTRSSRLVGAAMRAGPCQARRRSGCAYRDWPAAPASSRRDMRPARGRSTAGCTTTSSWCGLHREQVVGLDQLEALVHQGRRVDGDLAPHGPVGMAQAPAAGVACASSLEAPGAERPARCREHDALDGGGIGSRRSPGRRAECSESTGTSSVPASRTAFMKISPGRAPGTPCWRAPRGGPAMTGRHGRSQAGGADDAGHHAIGRPHRPLRSARRRPAATSMPLPERRAFSAPIPALVADDRQRGAVPHAPVRPSASTLLLGGQRHHLEHDAGLRPIRSSVLRADRACRAEHADALAAPGHRAQARRRSGRCGRDRCCALAARGSSSSLTTRAAAPARASAH